MQDLKITETIFFNKEVSIDGATSTFAVLKLEHGTNKRGGDYRSVNQVNTANTNIANAARKYEEGSIAIDEMINVIELEGYERS